MTTTTVTKRRRGVFRGFASLSKFVRQVVSELKKVVRPTRNELITYTSVVLVFVLIIMTIVFVMDFAFGHLVLWVFGGGSGAKK